MTETADKIQEEIKQIREENEQKKSSKYIGEYYG